MKMYMGSVREFLRSFGMRKIYLVKKIPVEVEAFKWDGVFDGEIVHEVNGYPSIFRDGICSICKKNNKDHGSVDMSKNIGVVVHPGDWIIKEKKGNYYSIRPDLFEEKYKVLGKKCEGL